jgi:hypothetical protein
LAGIALCALAVAYAQDEDTKRQDPKDDLKAAAKKTGKIDSYAFEAVFEVESDFGGGGMGDNPKAEGRYEKDEGLFVSIGDFVEVVRIKDKIAFLRAEETEWELFDPDDDQGFGFERMFAQFKAPHEEMENLVKVFKDLEKTRETDRFGREDATMYKGELTEKGAKEFLPFKGITRWIPNAEFEGSAKVWISERGLIVKYEVETTIIGEFNENEFEVLVVRTVELEDIDDTDADLPEAAVELIESADKKKKEEKNKDKDEDNGY